MRRIRVAVIFGGRSSEHSISCISAGSILQALDPERFEAVPVGIAPDGHWVLQSTDADRMRIVDGSLPSVQATARALAMSADPTVPALHMMEPGQVPEALAQVDVVFPVLHGPFGEDGTIQGLLEMAGIPYVGSGVMASAVAMDKSAMKAMFRAAGLPVGPYRVVTDREWRRDPGAVIAGLRSLGDALFVKPARAGSSMGITKVTDSSGLAAAVEIARRHDPKVIVEAAIESAREIECGVLTDEAGAIRTSVCAEIVVRGEHEFYDFEAKYLDDAADLIVPARLPEPVEVEVRRLAAEAFASLSCEGLARVDFFALASGEVVINEVNTMPGFTPISMFPRMWAESGMDYSALVTHLVDDALRRGTGLR